jgi:ribosomal protein L11 methyltransferase
MPAWHRIRFRVPLEDEELLSAWLWAAGTEGIEVHQEGAKSSVVLATFREGKLLVKSDLAGLESLVPGAEWIDSTAVEETDWIASWRAAAIPISLGDRLLVDPREWEPEPPRSPAASPRAEGATAGRLTLRIPARTAFGVGSHESTRLAYELLEATPLAGRRVLDVGCGSGILAMAALLLGARSAVGFDFDPAAALLAGQYARHNGVDPALYAGTVAALAEPGGAMADFDVVVLNVLPHEIAEELGRVVEQLAPGGDLLVSGVIQSEAASVERAIAGFGCRRTGAVEAGEWIGLRFRKMPELAETPA